jgi:assimilatory nitrate reductase catalytic subunit
MERDPSRRAGSAGDLGPRRSTGRVAEIRRIQADHGDDAFAMLSGVSLTNEKSYLVGKFARLALHTANLDYNGRYCMVSAAPATRRPSGSTGPRTRGATSPSPTSCGSPVERRRDVPDHHQLHLAGPRPRGPSSSCRTLGSCPLARTADLFLPVRPGSDSALFGAVLHELIRHDWLDHDFIDATHRRLRLEPRPPSPT